MIPSRLLKLAFLYSLYRYLYQLHLNAFLVTTAAATTVSIAAFKFLLWGQVQVRILAPWPLWLRLPYQAPHGASRRGFSQSSLFTCSLSTAALMAASCSSVPSAAPPVHRKARRGVLLCWTSRGHVRLPWTSLTPLAGDYLPVKAPHYDPWRMSSHSFAR
ncbi:hypothetical protein EDB83DRAFT_2386134 [Lactarius deliciosus]|nr:hypothetical protein EDB83DRAFT_2386134 [Lactarius deliciosus]